MKKALQWLDENLEEVLLVIALAAMAVIMGIQVIARYIFGASLFLVGRTDPVYIYLGRIPECELLYEKMYFYQDRAVCGDVPKEGKSHFQRSESYI